MRPLHRILTVALAAMMLLSSMPVGNACGPEYTTPIFVFETSPDIPFGEFTSGKIGIVRPSFGRKTLAIAYRFLNGGSFSADVQDDLISALKGAEPEDEGDSAVEAWIAARKEIVGEEQSLPEIYTEREHGGYSFFPNCTKNAFEVATETLKNRAGTYGAEDTNVRAWLAAQDTVFQNCSGGSHLPSELGQESSAWLRKDRDYQIAAAHFYSLDFDPARARFEKIASDYESTWQPIAPYLVARTLVRQASLAESESKKREFYAQAESRLQTLSAGGGGKFTKASVKLLGLVRYNLRPEERVVELGRALAHGNDENVRQDLIDYAWLLDKFKTRALKAEDERLKKLNPSEETKERSRSAEAQETYQRIQRGELIEINYFPKNPDGGFDYSRPVRLTVAHDTPEAEILRAVEKLIQRPLTPQETQELRELHKVMLDRRAELLSPNSRWQREDWSRYEGDYDSSVSITLDLVPQFLRADDLSDWIFTVQASDPSAYRHAVSKWRQTDSPAWLVTSLIKAQTSSPGLRELMRAAEKITRTDPAYATVVYHLVRLKIEMGDNNAARKLLDEVMSQPDLLPVSAQNQFLERRMQLAGGMDEFLKSAQRKPVAFYKFGRISTLHKLFEFEKTFWDPAYSSQTQEEFEQDLADEYKDLLPWDDQLSFDDATADILNWHFSLPLLIEAARNPNVSEYLSRNLFFAAWTRAILLNEEKVALEITPDVLRRAPEMKSVLEPYLKSTTAKERRYAALFALLQTPRLSPYLSFMVQSSTYQRSDYFLAGAWWCPLEENNYTHEGNSIPKLVPKPAFLTGAQLEAARRERRTLIDLGDAKSYLGKQVLEWAESSPDDPRLPEALFIAVKANDQYKYGCDGWTHDEETRNSARKILCERYPLNSWTAKLTSPRE
jgi:hypothetical protein